MKLLDRVILGSDGTLVRLLWPRVAAKRSRPAYHPRRHLREPQRGGLGPLQRGSGTQPLQVGRQPGPQPPQICTMLGAGCTATLGANGIAFAIPISAAIPLSAPITASAANFILDLPQKGYR